ncbi:hypothetical protein Q0M25_13910, partial [Staphylococcus aureus]|nr:hypothetical protein [Staphylococcus aureus]
HFLDGDELHTAANVDTDNTVHRSRNGGSLPGLEVEHSWKGVTEEDGEHLESVAVILGLENLAEDGRGDSTLAASLS